MGYYRVTIHCRLPNGLMIDGDAIGGFHTTRVVEAPFEQAAGRMAIERLQRERKFLDLRAQSADPIVTVDAIEPTDVPPADAPPSGYAFYRDEP